MNHFPQYEYVDPIATAIDAHAGIAPKKDDWLSNYDVARVDNQEKNAAQLLRNNSRSMGRHALDGPIAFGVPERSADAPKPRHLKEDNENA